MESKQDIRLAYKARRIALPASDCAGWAAALNERLLAIPACQAAHRVMAYLAMPKEANVDAWIAQALADGKEVYVPVCTSRTTMVAARLQSLTDVDVGRLAIRIPKAGYDTVEPSELDMVLVPGVAFDTSGGRLGMGAGYYDRFLEAIPRESRVGVAWEMQLSPTPLPMDAHDCRMGMVVTELQTIYC